MAQQISTNTFGVAKWIVSADATQGTHTTISAALTSASSGDTIYIRDGSYTGNLTLKAGVNLAAFPSNLLGPNVIIIGTCTLSTAGTVTISGISLQTNSANTVVVSGSVASILNLIDCNLNCTNNTGISFTSSSASAAIVLKNCTGDLGTTGIALWVNSSAGTMSVFNCNFTNTGSSTTTSSLSAGTLNFKFSEIFSPLAASSTGLISVLNSNITCGAVNATGLAITGTTSTHNIRNSTMGSGTASCISVGTGATLGLSNCNLGSSNTNAVTGAGSIVYSDLNFSSTALMNVTTQTGGIGQGGLFQAPSAGYIGQQIRSAIASGSAVALTTSTPANITNISLTAGIWDVSALVQFAGNGATIINQTIISISSTSATLTTNGGDDRADWATSSAITAYQPSMAIPSLRITLTATTTYYLVAQAAFAVNTYSAYGRISATRVG